MSDPNNLEGDPPTREERAEMARELDAVAPTPPDKFKLMFGQQPTPRTDACLTFDSIELCETLERELAEAREEVARLNHALEQASLIYDAAREQRDRLAGAMRVMWPFIEEDYSEPIATKSFRASVIECQAALAAIEGKEQG